MDPRTLQHQIGLTGYVIGRNLEGITHQESLVQPQAAGSCLNWVLGHVVRTRTEALGLMGKSSPYPADMFEGYGRRDAPLNADEAVPLPHLLECFAALQEPLEAGLAEMTPEALATPAPFSPTGNPDETVGSLLAGICFHEAYHAGQLGLLRRVIGKTGALSGPED